MTTRRTISSFYFLQFVQQNWTRTRNLDFRSITTQGIDALAKETTLAGNHVGQLPTHAMFCSSAFQDPKSGGEAVGIHSHLIVGRIWGNHSRVLAIELLTHPCPYRRPEQESFQPPHFEQLEFILTRS
eukprot:5969783-Amphidinium_carterae.1